MLDVAIVGAGFAGLGMGIALRAAGRDGFAVFERADAVGGTWRDNTYPGVACDVPGHLYGYERHPNPACSGVYATGAEIHHYLRRVAEAEGLTDRIRLCSPMLGATWRDDRWLITIGGREVGGVTARSLVLACGRLTEPAIPEVGGLGSFPGPIFHSARWDHTVPLEGRRVAVVGTGASAVQLVPELVRRGAEVVLFQRTPAWIVPRGARAYTAAERARFARDPETLRALRDELYAQGEARFPSRSGDAAAAAEAERGARAHLAAQVADPALRAALTPGYAFGCKRVLLSDDFYPAVSSRSVTLEPSALSAVEHGTLVAASGARHDADVLVLATGFAASQQPYAELVRGEHGTLAEHWSAGMTSFASTVVPGFPNLFVLNGPNASLGHNSSVLMTEAQAAYVVRTLRTLDRRDEALRVRPEAERAYTAWIDEAAAPTPWIGGGCDNRYVDERSGRLTLLWPGTVDAFRAMLEGCRGDEFVTADAPGDPPGAEGEP
ncbi:MAG: NAD(P)/FAD-dependent oxidoreductase [Microbacterium sp.]